MPNWELAPAQESRALQYVVSDTLNPGPSQTFSILTPSDCGFGPMWSWDPYRGAMSVPSAYRAATLLAGLIGAMPLHEYEGGDGTPSKRISPTPDLLSRPSPPASRVETTSAWVLDYLFNGNALGIVAGRDEEGWATALWPAPAKLVQTSWDVYGEPVYEIGGQRFGSEDVFHVRGPHEPGALRGLGLLEIALGTFDLAREQARQAQGLAYHGVPTGVLTTTNPDVETSDLTDAKAAWLKAQSTRTVAALAPGMSFQPISWNPEEMELVAARKFTDLQIAQLFGVPLRYLQQEIGGLTYSNPTLDSLDLLKFTVDAHLERFEQAWNRLRPDGRWTKYNRDAILRSDLRTRLECYEIGLRIGAYTLPEVRDFEDLPPLDDPAAPPEVTDGSETAPLEGEPTTDSDLQEDPGGI